MRRLFILLCALLCAAAPSWAQTEEDPWARVGEGDRVPDFELAMTNGKRISTADLEGKVVWVCLWASWCPSCRKEFGWLAKSEEFAALLQSEDFVFLPIAREENIATIAVWLKKKGYDFPSAADPERVVYELFAEQEIPRNILVGRDGIITHHSCAWSRKSLAGVVAKAEEMLN